MFEWYNVCGYVGALLVLLAFLLLQMKRLKGHGLIYQIMNVLGALGILLSLVFGTFNLAALVQEAAWMVIGIYGMLAARRRRLNYQRSDI